jgi:DNA-binding MurR/RpiR family transcriptional regulator
MSDPTELSPPALPTRRAPSRQAPAPWSALDLLALAGRGAARVAQEQPGEVEIAAQLLERAALERATVWLAGDAAFEHARRLEGMGYRAVAIADAIRLPAHVSSGDILLVLSVTEVPLGLLSAARQRQVDTIVLTGSERRELEVGAAIFVDGRDERATELTQTFILIALCAQNAEWDSAETAA